MSVKTAGVGHFQIPTAPAAGTSVTSGAANAYTTTAIQLIASTAAALYITGVYAEEAAVSAATYKSVQLMIGAGGSETVLGQYLIGPSTGSTVTRTYRPIFPPIPVASGQRISVKTADSVGALATLVSIECIAQSNVVDDAIPVTTVTTVTNQLTAAQIATGLWQDATAGDFSVANSIGKSLYINNIAPGAAGGHLISGANAGTTTFGALTVTGALTATGGITGTITGNLVGTVSTLTTYTGNTPQTGDAFARLGAPAGASVSADVAAAKVDTAAIKLKTDNLPAAPASTTNITAGTITTVTNVTTVNGLAAAVITAASIAADAITAAKIADGAIDSATFAAGTAIPRVTLADTLTTYTNNTPQTGDSFGRIGLVGAGLTAITDKTNLIPASPAAVGSLMTVTLGQVVPLTDVSGDVTVTVGSALLSARAQGAGAWSLVGTTLTLKNPDGSIFRTFTTDSTTSPTSRT